MRLGLRIVLAALVVAMLGGMAWAGGLYYWHYKVERVLRYLEDGEPGVALQPDMVTTLDRAGCRALPNLMRAVRPDRPAAFLHIVTGQIVNVMNEEPAVRKADCDLRFNRRAEYRVELDDKPAQVTAKCARLQHWWAQHGTEVHQWWRFWTGSCRPAD
jgi:hypothetical protein